MHTTTVTRRDGKYHLECAECGLITAQPANRGGLIARGERHQASNGTLGGATASAVIKDPRINVRTEQVGRLTATYGVGIAETNPPIEVIGFVHDEPIVAVKGAYKRPAFQQAMFDDKCQQCGGKLTSPEGTFCTTAFPVKAVCRSCKTGVAA